MTDKEAMKQALEALESFREISDFTPAQAVHAITALRTAIAEAEKQEPVAWIEHHKGGDNLNWEEVNHPYAKSTPLYTHPPQRTEQPHDPLPRACNLAGVDYQTFLKIKAYMPVYDTTPPQRTWVGLTEQDLDYLCNLAYTGDEEFALAVQAKLMEKNA